MYINIDDFFFIKKKISHERLKKSFLFVANQKGANVSYIEKLYKKNKIKKITLPKYLLDSSIDIIIKTKHNKDFKFISIENFEIVYELKKIKKTLFFKKIKKFELEKINFFPYTYSVKNFIFQKLAKGKFILPKKFSDFNNNFFKNIATVIKKLLVKKKNKIKVSDFLKNFKTLDLKNNINSEIINKLIVFLNNFSSVYFKTSLTHGDFKCEHLFIVNDKIEFLIDWENVDERSVYFDLFNFFIPWFVKRSYNYKQIKNYICKFTKNYLGNFGEMLLKNYDLYFYIFALERYLRIQSGRSKNFNILLSYKRYNNIFKKLI